MRTDQTRRKRNGQYDFGPRCAGCNKPAGENYFSHPMTDCTDANGVNWADTALVLCGMCCDATDSFKTVAEFMAWKQSLV